MDAVDDLILADYLARLPPTHEGIASLMRERGIRGVPRNPCSCPLAAWLVRRWPGRKARVCTDRVRIADRRGVILASAPTPPQAVAFLVRMDSLRYEDLIVRT